MIDDLDAKINGVSRFMERDRKEGAWTDFNRLLERYLLKGEMLREERAPDDTKTAEEKQRTLFSAGSDA
jgi:3'-5' exoribonuclease